MSDLNTRLDKIKYIIEKDSFYTQEGCGGELNFHIFDYEPSEELVVRNFVKDLVKNYSYENSKIKPIVFDLFEMILEILRNEEVLDDAIQLEEEEGTEELFNATSELLKPDNFRDLIKSKLSDENLILIVGVGKAYPLVRSHTILNNLHSLLDKIPVIMFYPGMYDQKELKLFAGENFEGLKDDNYYRAFRLALE